MNLNDFRIQMNEWGRAGTPFFFLIDFELRSPMLWKLNEIDPDVFQYAMGAASNVPIVKPMFDNVVVTHVPITTAQYAQRFSYVKEHLNAGNSYLTNLTVKTEIFLESSLEDIFQIAAARYKLHWKNRFTCFSPETFIRIKDQTIFSYPMKGTIDASMPNAAELVIKNEKELAEHVTIVDLIRNDLSFVSSHVRVSRFRYLDEIKTGTGKLLQVSSEIQGKLDEDYRTHLGDILVALLPAGSISGAPKVKTLSIIAAAEGEVRGYYTGVAGIFDGDSLDSAVLIRFIEQREGKFYYRSGGGITTQSRCEDEYQEMIQKIYVPVN